MEVGRQRAVVQDAVVLAAGGSTRMGTPKALLAIEGTPLILLHVAAFRAVGLRVHVVLGAHADRVAAVLPLDVSRFVNPHWATTGPAESAALALAGLGPALVTPVDVPPATAGDLHSLIAASGPAVLSAHGVDGHPVRLDPPHTTGRLDERLLGAVRIASEDPNRALNLNTPDDWNSFLNSLKRPPR